MTKKLETIIVDEYNVDDLLKSINQSPFMGLDTETTGLDVYGKDNLFAITISIGDGKVCYCLLYTSPSPRDQRGSRMPSSA